VYYEYTLQDKVLPFPQGLLTLIALHSQAKSVLRVVAAVDARFQRTTLAAGLLLRPAGADVIVITSICPTPESGDMGGLT